MKRKRYEVRGMMEWHPVFKAGRSRVQVSFTGGHLCGGASTAASFETSDPVVQAVIESSPAFKSKRIRLAAEVDDGQSDRQTESAIQNAGSASDRRVMADPDVGLAPERARTDCASGAAVKMTALHEDAAPDDVMPRCQMEFPNAVKAGDFLQDEKGLPLERVANADQCIAEARRLGIDMVIRNR